jgi:hypothetical protein
VPAYIGSYTATWKSTILSSRGEGTPHTVTGASKHWAEEAVQVQVVLTRMIRWARRRHAQDRADYNVVPRAGASHLPVLA